MALLALREGQQDRVALEVLPWKQSGPSSVSRSVPKIDTKCWSNSTDQAASLKKTDG